MKNEQQEYIQRWIQRAEQDFKLVNIVLDSNIIFLGLLQ
jgi:hypothetical protein